MKNLLKIVTKCIDEFSERKNITRVAVIIGGEAVILHGIPRTTLDIDTWVERFNVHGSLLKSPNWLLAKGSRVNRDQCYVSPNG